MRIPVCLSIFLFSATVLLGAEAGSLILDDFGQPGALDKWELTRVEATLDSRGAATMSFAERESGGPWPTAVLRLGRRVLPGNDWMAWEKLLFDVANPGGEVIELRAGVRDTSGTRVASGTFSIAPGASTTCEIPVDHVYRKVSPEYEGRSEAIDRSGPQVLEFYILLTAPQTVSVDNVRLVARELSIERASLLADPFRRGSVTVLCDLSRAARCEVLIRDSRGALMDREIQRTHRFKWRWNDPAELATMPPGAYTAELAVTDIKWDPDNPLRRELGSFEIVAESRSADIAFWYEPTTEKVMLDSRPAMGQPSCLLRELASGNSPDMEPLRIDMARNEVEGGQVVFLSRDRTVRLSFRLSGLELEGGGARFPLEGSEILQVGYVETKDPVYYEVDHIGWWPDALLPVEQMYAHPGECMPVWINLRSAPGTPAGTYRGSLEVMLDSRPAGAVPVEVRVHDPVLPTGTTIRTAFTTGDELIREIHGGRLPGGMMRKYHRFVADHRLNVDNIYRSSPPDIETVQYFHDRGQLNAFNLKYIGGRIDARDRIDNEQYLKELADQLDPYVEELRRRDLADKAYLYGFDEIGGEMYDVVKRTFGFLRERYPEIPTMTTGRDPSFGIDSGLEEEVDIWVPLTPVYDLERAEQARARGKEVWWYICIAPPHPYANWFVEYPAIEPRLLWWMTYQQQVPGFLYYFINLRHGQTEPMQLTGHNKTNWNPASWRTANGDGCLFYSGPDGPVSTVRFENLRDGLEDTELLFLLEQRLGDSGKASRGYCDMLIRSLTDYTRDSAEFARVRRDLLDRLSK